MKRLVALVMALCMVMALVPAAMAEDYSDVTIRIYSNTNDESEVAWLKEAAKAAGFNISIDDNTVISGDAAAIQAANENKDGDVLFGMNETRWNQVINGTYENLSLVEWCPTWADQCGTFYYENLAYGITIQDVLMLYRTDEFGTNGKPLHFAHWSEMAEQGLVYYRQGKVGGTTNGNINNCMLFPYADPTSPAGGISVEGWKKLWNYCAGGLFTGDSYGFDPLNRGDVQLSTFYSSSLYGNVDVAEGDHPLTYDAANNAPGNWALVDIDDGSYYIAEYIGVLAREGRTERETEAAKAFCEWFGSTETQTAWANTFDRYPVNKAAAEASDMDDYAGIYALKNMAQEIVPGTEMKYYEYVAANNATWTNIMTNLGYFWKDMSSPSAEPDWDNLDWATLVQKAA
ncbi:MAG: extracellular solute-binding protein [Clostridia bacterium]|nr:extracellular solute-binding protein [Clostridia bacterium]